MKTLGSALLITGTAIGAGMLGIPMATAGLGFWSSVGLLGLVWLLSYWAALLLLEATVNTPGDKLHLNSLAKQSLGSVGQILIWICVLGLLYSLTVAYISGASSLLKTSTGLPQPLVATVFTLVLGSFVVTSHRAADLLNRSFFSVKTVLLLLVLVSCMPVVDFTHLDQKPLSTGLFLSAAPVIFVSFGFHHIIPSMVQYNLGSVHLLKRIILIGSLLPLVVYIAWQAITLGILPRESIPEDVGQFIQMLGHQVGKPWLVSVINAFANLALVTSFLGVSLGLFDFLCDSLKIDSARVSHRLGVGLLTYLPPVLCAIYVPTGFIELLAYGGVFFVTMAFILPGLMVLSLRRKGLSEAFRVKGGALIPAVVISAGLLVIGAIFYT